MESEFKRLVEKGEKLRMKIEDAEINYRFDLVDKYDKQLREVLNDISILLKAGNKQVT